VVSGLTKDRVRTTGTCGQLLEAVENLSVAVGAAEVIEQGVPKGIIMGMEGKAELAHYAKPEVGRVDGSGSGARDGPEEVTCPHLRHVK
jgi:hypothetical protein